MKFNDFHYLMTHDEFGEGGLLNNYYFLFGLFFCYIILMVAGAIGWLMFLTK